MIRVVDGDTIIVKPAGSPPADGDAQTHGATVRLLGIDAPELYPDASSEPECGARAAKAYPEELLPAGTTVAIGHDPVSDHTDADQGSRPACGDPGR